MIKFSKLGNNKKLIENFSYLSILQLFDLLFPLITYPYLIKVLGKETYGLVIFAQSIASFFKLFISFGLNLFGAREVSIHRNNNLKLSELISNITAIKSILLIIAFIILQILINTIDIFQNHPKLFYLVMWMAFYEILFPFWYYQGKEKMQFITITNISIRSIFLILIFSFIKTPEHYLRVPLFNAIGAFIAGIITIFILIRVEKLRFPIPKTKIIKEYVKESYHIFIFKATGALKAYSGEVVIGLLSGFKEVLFFNLANKIMNIINKIFTNFSVAIFPQIAQTKNIQKGIKALKLTIILSTTTYLISALFLPYLIRLWDIELLPSAKIYWFIGSLIPIYAVAQITGNSLLIAHGYAKQQSITTIWTTILFVITLIVLSLLDLITIKSFSITLVVSQSLATLHKLYYCKKFKLLKYEKNPN